MLAAERLEAGKHGQPQYAHVEPRASLDSSLQM